MTPGTTHASPRETLAQRLIASGHLHSRAAIDAFRTTDRHAFLPGVDLDAAYKEDAVPIKHDEHGEMISCISAPSIVATQLEQLDTQPGHKVLETGAATGCNAALLGKIVSPRGQVWALDVDQDLVAQASKNLPVKILDQLAPGGRLVLADAHPRQHLPFLRRQTPRRRVEDRLLRDGHLRSPAQRRLRRLHIPVPMAGEGNVRLETFSEQNVDRVALRSVLDEKQTKLYTGVKFRQGSAWEWLYLYLACVLPNGLSRMPGQRPGFTLTSAGAPWPPSTAGRWRTSPSARTSRAGTGKSA